MAKVTVQSGWPYLQLLTSVFGHHCLVVVCAVSQKQIVRNLAQNLTGSTAVDEPVRRAASRRSRDTQRRTLSVIKLATVVGRMKLTALATDRRAVAKVFRVHNFVICFWKFQQCKVSRSVPKKAERKFMQIVEALGEVNFGYV